MLEIKKKNTVTEMKKAFDDGEQNVWAWEYLSVNLLNWEAKRKKDWKQKTTQDLWDSYKWCKMCVREIPEGEEIDKERKEIFETIMTENPTFSQKSNNRSRKLREQAV